MSSLRCLCFTPILRVGAVLALLSCQPLVAAEPQSTAVDPSLTAYRPGEPVSGTLTLVGSNTMAQVASIWGEGFKQFHPDVTVDIQIKGALASVVSVIDGRADMGLLSRNIHQDEIGRFTEKFGYGPTLLTPTYERIAIFVNERNPIEGLTLAELDAIYSSTRLRGGEKPIRTWGDLGVTGVWAAQPIICEGRNTDTGSQVFLQQVVLGGGEFREDLKTHDENIDIIKAIAAEPRAIGFAGAGHHIDGIRAIRLAAQAGGPYVAVDSYDAAEGQYPLIRPLQLVINQPQEGSLPALQREFLKYVFSRFGQEDVLRAGLQPIPAQPAQTALDAVGLGTIR